MSGKGGEKRARENERLGPDCGPEAKRQAVEGVLAGELSCQGLVVNCVCVCVCVCVC